MTPEELRADVPALDDVVYLNTGAAAPNPRRVVEASRLAQERLSYEAPAEDGKYAAAQGAFDDARAAVADHVDADPDAVALTQSTTHGIGRLVAAMDWSPGDVVVRTDLEHAAGIFPCQRLARRHGAEVRVVETEGGRIDRESYEAAVEGAKLVLFSSLTWTHGTRQPVTDLVEVAHDAGARVLVDAVQSVGQRPVDLDAWGADAVAAGAHKWLMGTSGAGFLAVDPAFARELTPPVVGYRSVEDAGAESYVLRPDARRFEVGTAPVGPYAAMREGMAILDELGYDTVTDRIERLTDRLKEGLGDERLVSPREYESGLVTFTADDPEATVDRLADAGIRVRSLPHGDTVRASVHVFNDATDVDALLDAL
ncbi:MAG: aminotransferase class V-fold PLP-dependent enzyme [Haloarculaceae archaeon]